jgi:predicted AlkP superfamily phosphohydrolase/phosphomutase
MANSALIIGIDGATWTVLKPAMERGYMPFMKSLADRGASGILESTLPAVTPAAWGTFQNGRNPAVNGVLDFITWDKETKRTTLVNSTYLQQTIWEILSQSGKDVVAINVPLTYPPRPVNGYIVTGILTPSMESSFTYPPEFKIELLGHFPQYKILNLQSIPKEYSAATRPVNFINTLNEVAVNQVEAAIYLLKKRQWDLFMLHFQVTDMLQHALWKYLDPNHPEFDASVQESIFSTFYKLIDEQIQRLVAVYKENNQESIVIAASDHGFESHYRCINIANWLVQENYQILNRTSFTKPINKYVFSKLCGLFRHIPIKRVQSLRSIIYEKMQLLDYEKTKVVCHGGCKEGLVYVLEKDPVLKHEIEESLVDKLSRLSDSGKPVIRKIYTISELYGVSASRHLPDLIIEPENGYSIKPNFQPKSELFTSVTADDIMNIGKHHKDGIILVSGQTIQPNSSLHLRLIDIVPTLLYYFQISTPEVLEGRVCTELFNDSFIKDNPVPQNVSSRSTGPQASQENVYSAEDQELIRQRLRALGYLE